MEIELKGGGIHTITSSAIRARKVFAIPESGALVEWWRELREHKRTRYDFDSLWRAACHEAAARDAIRNGLHMSANDERRRAAEIIVRAAAEYAA